MKLFCQIAAVMLFVAITISTAHAQAAPAGPQPTPAQSAGVIPDSKVAVIDTEAFADPKTGVKKLIAALDAVGGEFKQRSDELQKLKGQYDQLVKDIDAMRNVGGDQAVMAKVDQAKTLENDIKRKSEDAQRDYEKRLRAVTDPIYKDLSTALQAYASQRGITLILDASKMEGVLFVVNNAVDLTPGFIADYNQRNPSPATTPAKP